jgi:hypothetical protein
MSDTTDPDEGLLQKNLRRLFGRSWQTSIAGWLALGGTITTAAATATDSPTVMKWAPVVASTCVSIGVMLSKSQNVSGLNR